MTRDTNSARMTKIRKLIPISRNTEPVDPRKDRRSVVLVILVAASLRMVRCRRCKNLVALFDQKISQNQTIHLAPGKCAESVFWSVHDRFAAQIKGRIENHRNARRLSESLNQLVVQR